MHLTILTQYYPPEIGAPQARLSELASHFVARGHSVTVLTAMPNYPTGKIHPGYGGVLRREARDGVDVVRTLIYPTKRANLLHRLTNYFSFVFSSAVFGPFTVGRPDYVLVESPPLFLGLSGLWLSRTMRSRLIFNVSDLWPESAVRLGLLREGSLSYRLSAALEAMCYRGAWVVTGQSRGTVASISERFPGTRVVHLSNGVDTRRFGSELGTEQTREAIGAADGTCAVLYAGLHGLAQGLDQLVQAAQLLQAEGAFQFTLLGDGPQKVGLMAQAVEQGVNNLRFLDPRPARDIPAFLAAADVLFISLKMDIPGAVPSKLYEAMATGRPVLLVATGEAADIVHTHQAGLAVAPGDVQGIVRALRTLRADPQLRRRLGDNGRRAAQQHFDRAAIATRFIDYLEAELQSAPVPRWRSASGPVAPS